MSGRAAREGLPLDTTDESALDDLSRLNNDACDLDDLKTINDRHGHAAGDRVIETLARRWTIDIGSARLFVTVSIGVVAETGPSELDELLSRADEALYRAKSRGRNQVAV